MGISTINAGMVKNAGLAGAKGLAAKKEWINELNVFPVPDGGYRNEHDPYESWLQQKK